MNVQSPGTKDLGSENQYNRQPIGYPYPYNESFNATPIEGVTFTSFFLVVTSNPGI